MNTYRTLKDLDRAFPDRQSCMAYLERMRWKDGPVSPYNEKAGVRKVSRFIYHCKGTGRRFNVLTGTIFWNTKVPLLSWFKVIWLLEVRPGISTVEAEKVTGIKQKTVWSMIQRITGVRSDILPTTI